MTRLLTIAFVSSEEFLSHYRDRNHQSALFARTRTALADDQRVVMEIAFPGLPNRALIRGKVANIRPGLGAWIIINPGDTSTRKFLVRRARKQAKIASTINRSFTRYPAELPVNCTIEINRDPNTHRRLVTHTGDVGAGGVFVCSSTRPPVGASVRIAIGPMENSYLETAKLEGRVAWTREDNTTGFGVRFRDKSQPDARMIRTLLRQASERGKVAFG